MSQKILIIEDNEQDQKIISRFLKKSDYEVCAVVDSGEKGIASAKECAPDIIILDTVLPGMNGFETCRMLKTTEKVKTKIIIATGRLDAVDAQKAKQAGADDYCVKTSDCALILEAIRKVSRDQKEDTWGLQKSMECVKILYQELEKKNAELKKLNTLQAEFVSTASHELRTPLTIIKEAISQVNEGLFGEVNIQQAEKLVMAIEGVDRLRRMIDDLLETAKLEAKKIILHKKKIDLIELARETQTLFYLMAQEKELSIDCHLACDQLIVEADRDRILQVLINLVGNALKFTEQGRILITVKDCDPKAEFSVTDTGCGIGRADLDKVFSKFEQFGKSNLTQKGTGLGLAISKDIVELHGGAISVESVPGKGSTFTVCLPKKDAGQ